MTNDSLLIYIYIYNIELNSQTYVAMIMLRYSKVIRVNIFPL